MAKTINLGKVGITLGGDYDSSKNYASRTCVFYNHVSWTSKKDVPAGIAPGTNDEYWQKVSERGAQGIQGERGPQGNSAFDGTGIELVNNLTQGGEASALSAEQGKILKTELTELESEVRNIPMLINGYINTVGKLVTNASWRATPYFAVSENEIIEVNNRINDNTPIVYFYDEHKQLLSEQEMATSGAWGVKSVTTPKGAVFARVNTVHSSSDNYYTRILNPLIQDKTSSILEKVYDVEEELTAKTSIVIAPIVGLDWSLYTKDLSNNFLFANYQDETIAVKGVVMPAYLFDASAIVCDLKIYYADLTDMSSMVLLKQIGNPKDVNYIIFDEPVKVGGNKQIFIGGRGVKYYSGATKGITYSYDGTSLSKSENSSVCMAYALIKDASISEILSSTTSTKDSYLVKPTDIVKGFWYQANFNNTGNFLLYRTHPNAILLQDMTISITNVGNLQAMYGLSLYDAEMNPIGNYPNNIAVNKTLAIRVREILYYKPNATYCRINFWCVDGDGNAVDMPKDARLFAANAEYKSQLIVDKNGLGNYITIQEAVDNAFDDVNNPVVIKINAGIYDEILMVKGNRYLSFIGEDKTHTIIQSHTGLYNDAPITIDGDFTIENLTLKMLADKAPTWTSDMKCGYALHIDGGNSDFPPFNGEYKHGLVKDCILYSVSNSALGCGLHQNTKMTFENCDFIRETTKQEYIDNSGTNGAFLIHDATDGKVLNQRAELIGCRCYSNLTPSAYIDFSRTIANNVTMIAIGNSFYDEQSESNNIVYDKSKSTLHKISNGNNNDLLNS